MFESCPPQHLGSSQSDDPDTVAELVRWFAQSLLEQTFFEINVDSSLTESYFVDRFSHICSTASKVSALGASVVVFLDGKKPHNLDTIPANNWLQR